MMDWINGIRINLQTVKSRLETLNEEASVLTILENDTDGLLAMIKVLNKLKSFEVQDSFYELFSLVESIVEILGGVSKKAKEIFILSTAEKCLDVVISPAPLCPVKMEVLRLVNLFLEDTSPQIHQKILQSDEGMEKLEKLFLDISTVGDIELQSMMVECLLRFLPTKMAKSKMLGKIQTDPEVLSAFLDIRGHKFEVDCRFFLNKLNKQNRFVHKRVLSFPADYVKLDSEKLFKPSEDGYDDFWIDFNTGSKRISIFCQPFLLSSQLTQSDARWETLSLRAQDIKKFDCAASGKIWKIAIELKSNAQLLAHPEAEDQPHLFLCGIKKIYDAKSALNETFGQKTSTVDFPLVIGKKKSEKTKDSSESSCISFSNVRDQVQIPKFPATSQKISSKSSVHGHKQEKSSVPCDLMCYPASSTISQDSNVSSSLCVSDVLGGRETGKHQGKSEQYAHHKDDVVGLQSCKGLKKSHIDASDSKSANLKKNKQMTQEVETHDKKKKLLQDKSDHDKSEKDKKHEGKFSTKKDTSEEKISTIKRSGFKNVCQKVPPHKQLDSDSVAPNLMYEHLSPMTPGGDGFSLSFAKPENSKRQKYSILRSQASKVCISGDKEKYKGTIANDRKFHGHLTEDKVKRQEQAQDEKHISPKLSGCQNQRQSKFHPLGDFASRKEDYNFSTDIIPDSLPGQAPQINRWPCEISNASKASKGKTKTTLKDVLGSGKNSKTFPSKCQENKSVIKTCDKVMTEADNTDEPVIYSGSRRCKKNKKRTQNTKNKIFDASSNRDTKTDYEEKHQTDRDKLKNKKHHANQNTTVSFSPRSDQLIDTHKSKENFTLSKTETQNRRKCDTESLSPYSKAASSESGQLYIEIDTSTRNKHDNEDSDEVINETQIATPRVTAAGKTDLHNIQKKSSFDWPGHECNGRRGNQNHSSEQFINNDFVVQPHSVPMESSYVFKNKYKKPAPLSTSPEVQTFSSKLVSNSNEREQDMTLCHDKGREKKNKLIDTGKTLNALKQSKNSHVIKGGKNLGSKTLQFTSKNSLPLNKNQVTEKQAVEERPSRTLRARKNINYKETDSCNQSGHENIEQPPSSLFNPKQNGREDWQRAERFPVRPLRCEYGDSYRSKNTPGTKSKPGNLSTISKREESWHEVNTLYDKTTDKVKHGVTIKHNRQIKTVTSSFTAKDQTDPYDFDFECKIRSRDMQQFVPYKSWSMYTPALENEKPQAMSQKDNHRKSKKSNEAKSVFRSSQISCQKRISFNDSKISTDRTKYYGDSDVYHHKDKSSDSKKRREKNSSKDLGGWRKSSPRLFESQEPSCWKPESSTHFTSEQPGTPRSSDSSLHFPPLQDYSSDSPSVHNDAGFETNSFCDISASGRSDLSWVKAKKIPPEEIRKKRGKTYGNKKDYALTFQKEISDVENDEIDEELDIASWRNDVIVISPFKERIMTPLEKSPPKSNKQSMESDTNLYDETDKQDYDSTKKGFGTLSSILYNTDTDKKKAVTKKRSSCKKTSIKSQKSLEISDFDEEKSKDSELEEDSISPSSPKLSLEGSSQNLSSLSVKFDNLFQEVMSKVSRDEPDLCNDMETFNPVVSGPSSKQRLTKSALKRKYPTLSSVSFSDDTRPKKKKRSPKVVKRKLFMSETESEVKPKCSNSSTATQDNSPLAPFTLSPLTSPLIGFSKVSSGSSLSLEHTKCVTTIRNLAQEEEEDPLSEKETDKSDTSSDVMFPTSKRTNVLENVMTDTSTYDMKSQLKDVFRSACQPSKSSKFTGKPNRLNSFNTFMESVKSAYTKMKRTEREMKRTEAEAAMLWFKQSQKLKDFRSAQDDSFGEMRKAYDEFVEQLQMSQTGEESLKTSMKRSLSKDYEDLKKNLRAKYNTHSLEAVKRCLQASIMLS